MMRTFSISIPRRKKNDSTSTKIGDTLASGATTLTVPMLSARTPLARPPTESSVVPPTITSVPTRIGTVTRSPSTAMASVDATSGLRLMSAALMDAPTVSMLMKRRSRPPTVPMRPARAKYATALAVGRPRPPANSSAIHTHVLPTTRLTQVPVYGPYRTRPREIRTVEAAEQRELASASAGTDITGRSVVERKRDEQRGDQGGVDQADRHALPGRQRVVARHGVAPAPHERHEPEDQHDQQQRRPRQHEGDGADRIAGDPVAAREGAGNTAAVERRHRYQIEQVEQHRRVAERHEQRILPHQPGTEHGPRRERARDRARHRDARLHGRVARLSMHRDEGADERNEHRRPGRNAFTPERHRVTHLLHEDQEHEAGGEGPAPLERVGADGQQQRGERLPLQHPREQSQELGLAEDEQQPAAGRARSDVASHASLARRGAAVQALVDGAQIVDLARAAFGVVHHVASASFGGRGITHAS